MSSSLSNSRSSLSELGGSFGYSSHSDDGQQQNKRHARTVRPSLDVRTAVSVKPLTRPKEFSFATAHRSRPNRFLSREEQEELELQSRPQYRANPLPVHVLEPPALPPPAPKRPLTQPESPMFHTTVRLGKKRRFEETPETTQQETINTSGKKAKKHKAAKPFQLMTDQRGQQSREALQRALEEERRREEELRQFRARPLPSTTLAPSSSVTASQTHTQPKPTRPKPFPLNTESRGQLKREALARRLDEEKREQSRVREFRARPLRCDEPFVAQQATAPLTEPKPFPLQTEVRGSKKVNDLHSKLAQEAYQDKENRCFRAKPLPCAEPFKPRPSDHPLTVPECHLSSDTRALERAAFDAQMKAKEAAEAEARRQAQLEREKQERKEIRRLRRSLVHKARPIPASVYQPMAVLPSSHPLTEPVSPPLHTKRVRLGHKNASTS